MEIQPQLIRLNSRKNANHMHFSRDINILKNSHFVSSDYLFSYAKMWIMACIFNLETEALNLSRMEIQFLSDFHPDV